MKKLIFLGICAFSSIAVQANPLTIVDARASGKPVYIGYQTTNTGTGDITNIGITTPGARALLNISDNAKTVTFNFEQKPKHPIYMSYKAGQGYRIDCGYENNCDSLSVSALQPSWSDQSMHTK